MNRWTPRPLRGAVALVAIAALTACAYPPPQDGVASPGSGGATARSSYGVVSAIEPLPRESSSGPGTGAALGGAEGDGAGGAAMIRLSSNEGGAAMGLATGATTRATGGAAGAEADADAKACSALARSRISNRSRSLAVRNRSKKEAM